MAETQLSQIWYEEITLHCHATYCQTCSSVRATMIPDLIRLMMDGDSVLLTGLTACWWTHHNELHDRTRATIYRLSLSAMTECQIKRRHSVTSLATTLANVQFAQSKIEWTSLGACGWSACVRTCSAKLLRYIHCEYQKRAAIILPMTFSNVDRF